VNENECITSGISSQIQNEKECITLRDSPVLISTGNEAISTVSTTSTSSQTEYEFGKAYYESTIYLLQKEISELKMKEKQNFGFFRIQDNEI